VIRSHGRHLAVLAAVVLAAAFVSACGGDEESTEEATGGFETTEDTGGGFVAVEPPPAPAPEPPTETTETEQPETAVQQAEVVAIGSTVPASEIAEGKLVVEFLAVETEDGTQIRANVLPGDRDRVTKLFLDDELGEGSQVEIESTDGEEWVFVDLVG
jgi:hypothetical protein